jgi:hypothetical protein
MGEHNQYVFEEVLGFSKKTTAELKKKGALN